METTTQFNGLTKVANAKQKKEAEVCKMFTEGINRGSMKMAIYDSIIEKYPMGLSTVQSILKRNGHLAK